MINYMNTLFILLSTILSLQAQSIRAVKDDIGYCWNRSQMNRLISYLDSAQNEQPNAHTFIGGISPHDDYLYAARVYYPLFRTLRAKEIVIFGVTHGTVRREIGDPQNIIILDNHSKWTGCEKDIAISPLREFIKARLDTQYFHVNDKAHELEHSIEAMIPWIQSYSPETRITPIMVTAMPFERMQEITEKLSLIIQSYMHTNHLNPGSDIFFLISSDANHYGEDFKNVPWGEDATAHQKGIENDRRIASMYCNGIETVEKTRKLFIELQQVVWCGKYSMPFGLLVTQHILNQYTGKNISSVILDYSDSYSTGVIPLRQTGMGTTAPFSLKHWVGYLSVGFYLPN